MRAVHLTDFGAPEDVLEIRDVPRPEPDSHEVRLEVKACGLQHADIFARIGHPELDPAFPKRPGTEIAGIVDAVGDAVTDWDIGDRVNVYHHFTCGECEFCERGEQTMCPEDTKLGGDRPGGLAEFVSVPGENLERLPGSVSFDIGAAWPSSFTTAWRMMVTAGNLRPAESALILGASGGVGHAALQIADSVGATPFATTSADWKAEKASEWAESVIDYTETSFDAAIKALTDDRGVDLVADHVGQETWQQSINSLATNGRMVICGATSGPDPDIDIRSVYQRHRRIIGAPMGNRQDFRAVGRSIADGHVEPVIDRRLPLADVAEGHRAIEERNVFGKVIIHPQR
ncbi:MAG: zinc-binding dehydrogenase [Halobacteriales archaeon]